MRQSELVKLEGFETIKQNITTQGKKNKKKSIERITKKSTHLGNKLLYIYIL